MNGAGSAPPESALGRPVPSGGDFSFDAVRPTPCVTGGESVVPGLLVGESGPLPHPLSGGGRGGRRSARPRSCDCARSRSCGAGWWAAAGSCDGDDGGDGCCGGCYGGSGGEGRSARRAGAAAARAA